MNPFIAIAIAAAVISTATATISFIVEPRRLINGLLINIAFVCDMFTIGFGILSTQNQTLIVIFGGLFICVFLAILLFFGLHLVWLIWNAIIVWKRESHSLANMLTLLLAIGIVLVDLFGMFGARFMPDYVYESISALITLTVGYLLIVLWNFLTILVAYNLRRPIRDQDFLIVLGAGLIDGHKVSRLLGARIDVAINYYQKQQARGRKLPRIIFSGGQGGDEQLSEAAAMQQYALNHGIPETATLLENQSKTTLENMQFSSNIIHQQTKGEPYRAQFCTNNYHLFRAGLFAKEANLTANGMGAHTAFYFLPNATIREFAAIFLMNKRRHAITLAILALPALVGLVLGMLHIG